VTHAVGEFTRACRRGCEGGDEIAIETVVGEAGEGLQERGPGAARVRDLEDEGGGSCGEFDRSVVTIGIDAAFDEARGGLNTSHEDLPSVVAPDGEVEGARGGGMNESAEVLSDATVVGGADDAVAELRIESPGEFFVAESSGEVEGGLGGLWAEDRLIDTVLLVAWEGPDAVPAAHREGETRESSLGERGEGEADAGKAVLGELRLVAQGYGEVGAPLEAEGLCGEEEGEAWTGPFVALEGPAGGAWASRCEDVDDVEVAVLL
jgi:hypothetical protein